MAGFDWQTDEEGRWETQDERPPGSKRSVRVASWRVIFSVVLVFLAGGMLFARLAHLRLEAAQDEARTGVMAAHELMMASLANHDEELFASVVADDPEWAANLTATFNRGSPLGWHELEVTSPLIREGAPPTISLAPDLQSAIVTTMISHTVRAAGQPVAIIPLQHELRYLRDGEGWYWGPFEESFWGAWITDADDRITAVYSERDAAAAAPVVSSLRDRFDEICDLLAGCPDSLKIQLRFLREPGLLAGPSRTINAQDGRFTLGVPTPTLVGLPLAEGQSDAPIRDAYLRLFASELLNHLVRDDARDPRFLSAARRQLEVDLELATWPPPRFADMKQQPLPISETLQLLCTSGLDEVSMLYRFNPASSTWIGEALDRPYRRLAGMPDGAGLLLQEEDLRIVQTPRRVIWRRMQLPDISLPGVRLLGVDPAYNVAFGLNAENRQITIHLGELAECTTTGCAVASIVEGYALPSPGGDYWLRRDNIGRTVYLGSRQSRGEPVGAGYDLFWLDERTYGVVTYESQARFPPESVRIVLGDVMTGEEKVLTTAEELAALLPSVNIAGLLFLGNVRADPGDPDRLLLLAAGEQRAAVSSTIKTYAFTVSRSTGEPTLQFELENALFDSTPQFAPGGRWFSYILYGPRPNVGSVMIHDLDTQTRRSIGFRVDLFLASPWSAWSASHDWLAILHEGLLTLYSPETGLSQTVVPPAPGCAYGAWAG